MTTIILDSGYTGLGTATAKTQLGGASVVIPQWAKSIVAVIPQIAIDVPTVSESFLPLVELESNDIAGLIPFQVMANPINAILGATVGSLGDKNQVYQVNCPVNGGEQLNAYMTALVANTAAPTGGCGIVVSSDPVMGAQRHGKVGTLTNSGTTASSDVAGTRYNFSGARRIVETDGFFGNITIAAADAVMGHFKFTSNEFIGPADTRLPMEPITGGLSSIFSTLSHVARQKVNIQVGPGQVNIQDYIYMGLAPASTGNFLTGVLYE